MRERHEAVPHKLKVSCIVFLLGLSLLNLAQLCKLSTNIKRTPIGPTLLTNLEFVIIFFSI